MNPEDDHSRWVSALDKLMDNPDIHRVQAEKFGHVMLNPEENKLTIYDPVKVKRWVRSDTYVEVEQ